MMYSLYGLLCDLWKGCRRLLIQKLKYWKEVFAVSLSDAVAAKQYVHQGGLYAWESWCVLIPDCSNLCMKTPKYSALDESSVGSVKEFQAKEAPFTDHLSCARHYFSCFHMLSLLVLIMVLWRYLCFIDKEAKAKRCCVACSGSHSWKRVGLGFGYKYNWLQSPCTFFYTAPIIYCFNNAAWWMTGNHKTSVACNSKCILLIPLGSAGSRPGTSAVLGWAQPPVLWLTGYWLI